MINRKIHKTFLLKFTTTEKSSFLFIIYFKIGSIIKNRQNCVMAMVQVQIVKVTLNRHSIATDYIQQRKQKYRMRIYILIFDVVVLGKIKLY